MTILEKLADLGEQATKEHSHYYVRSVVVEAIKEIKRLQRKESRKHRFGGCSRCWEKWGDPAWGEKYRMLGGQKETTKIMLQERRCTVCNKRQLREAN